MPHNNDVIRPIPLDHDRSLQQTLVDQQNEQLQRRQREEQAAAATAAAAELERRKRCGGVGGKSAAAEAAAAASAEARVGKAAADLKWFEWTLEKLKKRIIKAANRVSKCEALQAASATSSRVKASVLGGTIPTSASAASGLGATLLGGAQNESTTGKGGIRGNGKGRTNGGAGDAGAGAGAGAGGVAVVEWVYSAEALQHLKQGSAARTRHQAVFADVLRLLEAAGHTPLATASISRDARGRGGLPDGHFGNATLITVANLDRCHSQGSACGVLASRTKLAAALRNSIETGDAVAQLSKPADIHFTSWWHPLQRDLDFGGSSPAEFNLGPDTVTVAAKLCKMTGKPNVTVLPAPGGGLLMSLRAPTEAVAKRVVQLLNERSAKGVAFIDDDAGIDVSDDVGAGAGAGHISKASQMYAMEAADTLVPVGHTPFSWTAPSVDRFTGYPGNDIPLSHTHFSWLQGATVPTEVSARRRDGSGMSPTPLRHHRRELPDQNQDEASPRPLPTCALLWLHGLGDTGNGWRGKFKLCVPGGLAFYHPTAPEQHVTAQNTSYTSWFDVCTWPISKKEPEPPAGIETSVIAIHALLDKIVNEDGIPPSKIVIGGFSQGGSLAIKAGLSYPQSALAGIVSISGWCTDRDGLASAVSTTQQGRTPLFFSCGTGDPIVEFKLTKLSSELLTATLGDHVVVRHQQRAGHPPKRAEMQAAEVFIRDCLTPS